MNTTYFLNCVAGNLFQSKTSPAMPTEYYVGLSSTAPAADGTGVTEPESSLGYSRVKLSYLSEPNNGVVTNTSALSFEESTGAWGTMTHYVIYDSKTGGNLLIYGALDPARTVEASVIMTAKADSIKLTLQNPS